MENMHTVQMWCQSSSFERAAVPEISVLLPTYKRVDALQRTLQGLQKQDVDNDLYEIVVIDDGSRDGTEDFLKNFVARAENRIYAATLSENGGPARARNVGLAKCRARVILIIGDDIEPETTLLAKHLSFHRANPDECYSLLGRVSFPEGLHPSGFMRWLEHGGSKYYFDYHELTPGEEAGTLFFYTCNVSVKASLLEKTGWFDESFRYASHEDLELGHRLAEKGMKLIYDDTARGFHWHKLSVRGISRRVYLMGYSANYYWQKVGDSGSWAKRALRASLVWLSTTPPLITVWQRLKKKQYEDGREYPWHWHVLLALGFLIGLSDARNKRSPRV